MKWENSVFEELVGKTVLALHVSDCTINFSLLNNKRLTYEVDGDCCSVSWFSDIQNADVLHWGAPVLEVQYLEEDIKNYNLEDGRCRQDVDEVYAYGLKTVDGLCKIFYRNSSNGYYSGYLSKVTSDSYQEMTRVYNNWSNTNKNIELIRIGSN